MKLKPIFLFCVISVWTFNAMAQSTFALQNGNAQVNAPVFDALSNRLSGTNYAAELWGGSSSNSLSPALELDSHQRVIVPFLTGGAAGYFSSAKSITVFQAFAGDFAWVQVRAWDARLGSTYEQVAELGMGGYGESLLLYIEGGNPTYVPPTSPRSLIGLQSFSLRPVPEPSIWQLSLLGAPILFWFGHRRTSRSLYLFLKPFTKPSTS
ncbi:MAG: hypothetical protein ABJC04_03400 [Verrucomicrobiota bacterium]